MLLHISQSWSFYSPTTRVIFFNTFCILSLGSQWNWLIQWCSRSRCSFRLMRWCSRSRWCSFRIITQLVLWHMFRCWHSCLEVLASIFTWNFWDRKHKLEHCSLCFQEYSPKIAWPSWILESREHVATERRPSQHSMKPCSNDLPAVRQLVLVIRRRTNVPMLSYQT